MTSSSVQLRRMTGGMASVNRYTDTVLEIRKNFYLSTAQDKNRMYISKELVKTKSISFMIKISLVHRITANVCSTCPQE